MNVTLAIELLQLARQSISSGRERYICDALRRGLGASHPTSLDLRRYIIEQLDGREGASLGTWMAFNQGKCYPVDSFSPKGAATLRLCRMAWIDRMIHSLQTEGKLP